MAILSYALILNSFILIQKDYRQVRNFMNKLVTHQAWGVKRLVICIMKAR